MYHLKKNQRLINTLFILLFIVALVFSTASYAKAEEVDILPSPSASGEIEQLLPSPTPSVSPENLPSPSSAQDNPVPNRNNPFKAKLFGATLQALGTPTVNTSLTDLELVNKLLGEGVSVSNITITGNREQIGFFNGAEEMLGFDNGLVLSTGHADNTFTGKDGNGQMGDADGDADLSQMSGFPSKDAIILEFDIISPTDTIFFQYMFASGEWDQDPEFNDNFALFVYELGSAKQNHAFLPNTNIQVSVQTILTYIGAPSGAIPAASKDIFVNTESVANFSFSGRTTLLDCHVKVTPGVLNHIKIVIADTSDANVDSVVFLKGGSLAFEPDDDSPKINKNNSSPATQTGLVGGSVTFEVDVTGEPTPTLQWQISTDGGKTWMDMDGETAAKLTLSDINASQNGSMYRLIAVNTHGTTISDPFTLNVTNVPPTGDAEDVLWYALTLAVFLVILTGTVTYSRKRNKQK